MTIEAGIIQEHVVETLLTHHPTTDQWEPHLAEAWEVSKDYKTFTFTLRKGVTWHDGQPVTAKDVAFSFRTKKDPSFGGIHSMPYYENIQSAQILGRYRVRFQAKKKYFLNLKVLGDLVIIPEHIYKYKDKKLNHMLMGSGPYILKEYKRGRHIILQQNPKWWGRTVKPRLHRIPRIKFRFIKDPNNQLLRMKSGDLDFIGLDPLSYFKKTNKKPWGHSLIKKSIHRKEATSYQFIGWDLNNPLFQDRNVRKALTHLMNRTLINQKLFFGTRILFSGPWDPKSEFADPSVQPALFNPFLAQKLLQEQGWSDSNHNGILDKMIHQQKREFRFTLIAPTGSIYRRILAIYQQDLKKNGIDMSLRMMDWSSFIKTLNERKQAAYMLGWAGGKTKDKDPKQMWQSTSSRKGVSNFIGYSNPLVDQLIDQGRITSNQRQRMKIYQKIYRLIAEDYPYLFLFGSRTSFYVHSKKVSTKDDIYPHIVGVEYWTINPLW